MAARDCHRREDARRDCGGVAYSTEEALAPLRASRDYTGVSGPWRAGPRAPRRVRRGSRRVRARLSSMTLTARGAQEWGRPRDRRPSARTERDPIRERRRSRAKCATHRGEVMALAAKSDASVSSRRIARRARDGVDAASAGVGAPRRRAAYGRVNCTATPPRQIRETRVPTAPWLIA